MKKPVKRLPILLAILLLLSSCSSTPDNPTTSYDISPLSVSNSYFVYNTGQPAGIFAVDEDGTTYILTRNIDDETIEHPKKNDWQPRHLFAAYDLDGNITAKCGLDMDTSDISNLHPTVGGGKLYFSVERRVDTDFNTKTDTIYTLDLTSYAIKELRLPVTFNLIYKLEYYDNKIYILAEHPDYGGNPILALLNTASGKFEIIYENLDSFALTPNGEVLIAARDGDSNYFAKLDPNTWQMNDPKYIDIGITDYMATDGHGVFFKTTITNGVFHSLGLGYTFLDDKGGVMAVLPDKIITGVDRGIMYTRGLCWITSAVDAGNGLSYMTLERFSVSDYINEPQTIKLLGSFASASDDQFGGGYMIDRTDVTNEELALSMLSQDNTYDVFHVASSETIAYNVKEKGSFYPLNDVPGVREYIDACFPFISEAATDDEGNIWMIPVVVGVNSIVYHAENSAAAGLDISNAQTPLDVMRFVSAVPKAKAGSYYLEVPNFILSCLLKYIRENDTLDTPEFREFAEALREFMKLGDLAIGNANRSDIRSNLEMLFQNYPGISSGAARLANYENSDVFDVVPVTGTSGSPSAYCEFLVVNQYSENLDAALDFISSVAQYSLTAENSFILADTGTYTDSDYARKLYALYESGTIDFNIPHEILYIILFDYLNSRSTLDEMITEAERMLNMYLNE